MTPAPSLSLSDLLALTPAQAGQLLGISRSKIYALIGDGLLLAFPIFPGGPIRVARTDLDTYVAARQREGQQALTTHLTLTQPAHLARERRRGQSAR